MTQHYFTAEPVGPQQRRRLPVELAGRRVEVEVAGGVFSPAGIDKGTRVLLREVPAPPTAGTFLDLGCGWGPLALTLGLLAPAATVYAVDVNERAVDLTRRNAASLDLSGIRATTPDGVPDGARLDLIWSNPPIRIGKPALHTLLRTWLPRLGPDGAAYLVVSKNLGADTLQRWVEQSLDLRCERIASHAGFRVLGIQGSR